MNSNKITYKQTPFFLSAALAMLFALSMFGMILIFGCSEPASKQDTQAQKSREEQMTRRAEILKEFRAKYGEDLSTWTPEQLEEITKAYEQ